MSKDVDIPRQDRSADRNEIADLMADYTRQGGLVSHLDWAGNVVGLIADKPTAPRRTAKILPFPKPAPAPVVEIPEPVVTLKRELAPTAKRPPAKPLPVKKAAPAPTAKVINLVPELRRIRADAERALARLNAAAERRTA